MCIFLPFIHSFSYTSPPHSRVAHSLPEKGRTKSWRLVPCRKKELNRRLIPCRKKERSRRLLARINGLCIQYPSGTAEAMPKFSADLFYVQVRPSTVVDFCFLIRDTFRVLQPITFCPNYDILIFDSNISTQPPDSIYQNGELGQAFWGSFTVPTHN